jgi:hypothetical protein
VAGRLAARHGITVRLRPGDEEGIAAYVVLPRDLLVQTPPEPAAPSAPITVTPPVERVAEQPVPARLEHALPRPDFEAGLQALLAEEGVDDPPDEPHPEQRSDDGEDAPVVVSATLTRRVPGATTEALPEPHREPPVRRSPDEVRDLLSRYRSGLRAGRDPDGPRDEERS